MLSILIGSYNLFIQTFQNNSTMKQLSLWFAFFSYAVLASLLFLSCSKENQVQDQKSLSQTSLSGERTSTSTSPANPAIAYQNNGNLMVMNADGANQTAISLGGGRP